MTDTVHPPSIFDSYNARALSPQDVAATFVPSANYANLVKRRHTLLVGPRGSGKTTLLKMLQSPALQVWEHPEADQYRDLVDYTGVFIPADISWNAQMQSLGTGSIPEDARRKLCQAAFTTHVLRAFVTAMRHRIAPCPGPRCVLHQHVDMNRDRESALATSLGRAWYIDENSHSLTALEQALSLRLLRIWELSGAEAGRPDEGRIERLASTHYLNLHALQAASFAVAEFNVQARADAGKWALLFDEMELAPSWVIKELFASMRSFDDSFFFKMSMSPFSSDTIDVTSATSPMENNDYDVIPLWYAHKKDSYLFCESLLCSLLQRKGRRVNTPEDVFGESAFEEPLDERDADASAYRPGSRHQKLFARLARHDVTFREYLERRGIDPDHLHELSESDRAPDVRKIMPLVVVRDTFRVAGTGSDGAYAKVRSRKRPQLYAGARSLFSIVEGNPRWFLGVVGPLLEKHIEGHKVKPAEQAKAIGKAAQRFCSLLKSMPCAPLRSEGKPSGLFSLVERIGNYFFDVTIRARFRPDPPGTFRVDSDTPRELLASLGQALNVGAIVHVPGDGKESVIGALPGRRFRLSYLLAAMFKLPIRLGSAVSLSTILSPENESATLFSGEHDA